MITWLAGGDALLETPHLWITFVEGISWMLYHMRMMRGAAKFVGGGVAIVAVGIGALFLIDYIRYQKST